MLSETEYDIVRECACGPEPFFVLVSSVYPGTSAELTAFVRALANLVEASLLTCHRGPSDADPIRVTLADLEAYVSTRVDAGESLDEHPEAVPELSFVATAEAVSQLRAEDQPVLGPG